jgi:hypothetical protein
VSPWKFVRRLTPAPSPTPSSRRTFPWRRLCRDLDRARTSLHAIALRLLRTALDDSPIRRRSSPVGLRHFYFYRPEFPKAQPLLAYEYWWTGEDSNLRSPQGAADLQSAGFSHSPTRPRKNSSITPSASPANICQKPQRATSENTKRTRVKRHQPVDFVSEDSLRLIPPQANRWSWRRELNPRPSDYKSDALPAELRQRSQTDKE